MLQKQNQAPRKQGVLYQLNLGKDNGPYLCKDIMHNNPKSISLLAGSQIVRSFASLNHSMNLSQSKQKEYYQTLMHVDSVSSVIANLEQEIQLNTGKDRKLKIEQMRLRQEFQQFNDTVNQSNARLLDEYMPLLKGLYKIVKEQACMQKQEMFRMQKQLREMEQTKRYILQGIFKCEQKIINIEKCFGAANLDRVRQSQE